MEKDYKKIGLKCGLEIHQQLNTSKLFCNCPSIIRDDVPDLIAKRKLKAVIGESGDVDSAASFTANANKTFIYEGYTDSTCAIEFDEEPPREINFDSLNTVLQVSKILNCAIVDEVQVMRKTVVDGSNTSGFQRTALVGRHGSLKTDYGHVGIPTISVEEDSAKIIERNEKEDYIKYNLSRLGIPLIEIGTDPDITTPEMAKDVAAKLGMILRSTGKVKRGLGTIRQDLNVSISGGVRVEIKGAQDLKMIPKWVNYEIERQQNLIEIKKELCKLKAKVVAEINNITNIFSKTESKVIKSALKSDGVVYAIKLMNFSGIIGKEVQPGRRLGTEFSDYAKQASGVKGLFHSDENLERYSLSKKEINAIVKELDCKKNDAFILIADIEEKAKIALDVVVDRAEMTLKYIPMEVRKSNPDGTTSFMRPMPSAARMYPETDSIPVVTEDLIKNIKIPELIDARAERYESEYNLSKDLANLASKFDFSLLSDEFKSFDDAVKKFKKLSPLFISQSILYTPKDIKKRLNLEFKDDNYKDLYFVLEKVKDKEIAKDALGEILPLIIKGKKVDYSLFKPLDDSELKTKLKKIISENKGAPFGALMGKAMSEFRGKVDGQKLSQLLKELSS